MQEILKKFLAQKSLSGKAESTLERYKYILSKLLNWIQETEPNKKFNEITSQDIRDYLIFYKEKNKVSNVTLENNRKIYASFFRWAAGEGYTQKDPSLGVDKIKCRKTIKEPFSSVEIEKIARACKCSRDLALIHFLYSTGARVSEVEKTNISDVNFQAKEVKILGKGNKERIVYLTDIASYYLITYMRERTDNNPALFVTERGAAARLKKSGIEATLNKLGKRSGVSNVHPHRFRRTLATDLAKSQVSIQVISEILGHDNISVTQVYVCTNKETVKSSYFKAMN